MSKKSKDNISCSRTYRLASRAAQNEFDLRLSKDIIVDTVHSVIPDAKVEVTETAYTVDSITRGDAIKIGKKLSKSFQGAAMLNAIYFKSFKNDFFTEDTSKE